MSTKEMKAQADFLYQKSSHYISGVFLVVGSILAILGGFSYYVVFMVLTILLEPLQYGVIKACLKAYDRKAREVDTKEYTLLGLKHYPSAFVTFVGKRLIIIMIQLIVLVVCMLFMSGNVDDVVNCIRAIITGSTDFVFTRSTDSGMTWYISDYMIFGYAIALLVGVFLDIKFVLSYYFAIDKDYSLLESLTASWKAMSGNFFRYIGLLLRYALLYIGATVASYLAQVALTSGFTQLIGILPDWNLILAIVMVVIIAVAATMFSVMIYKVKLQLGITVFYKEVTKEKGE